ncbi:hypothetical protein [Nostoc sp.]
MTKKPQTKEELIADEQQHPERGKINGQYVADISTNELNIVIPGKLYNRIIQIRAALSMTKSQIAQEAMLSAIFFLKQLNKSDDIGISLIFEGKSNFRGNVPQHLYRRAVDLGSENGLDKHQVGYLGLHLFTTNPSVEDEYQLFMNMRSAELGCSFEELEESIYGLSKALSRKERIKLINSGLAADQPKMDI